ncbi:beta-carotene 15,15'-monooxygenase [Halpernia sp.]|uniref:beta-carotene 15,15'-monooxygenase n=1 Tax=Halpernia sp. TaxID=2782209 RepID=UPI003A910EF7
MSDFNLDNFKKTWQEQEVQPKYQQTEIAQMLHKNSRNYVKYIFWISLAEFFVFFSLGILYIFRSESDHSFFNILKKLGVNETPQLQQSFEQLYFSLKIVSLLITAFFVVQFYLNYKKIKVQDNLKLFILQIVKFRKTVNAFIITNIFLLILFTVILTAYIFRIFSEQNISLTHPTLIGFIVGLSITTLFSVGLIWLYYKIVYGIIMKKLSKNLTELRKIEEE